MQKSYAARFSKPSLLSQLSGALLLLSAVVAQAAPAISSFFQSIKVDGNAVGWMGVSDGGPESFLFEGGTFHMWYRTSDGTISGLNHATSTDGINFTTVGSPLSFSPDPFPAGGPTPPPYLYFENAANVGGNIKIVHWTPTGNAGGFPAYDYNNSVTNVGANPNNTVTTHQGAMGGGTAGQTAGSFGIVNNNWYGQCGPTGREICRAAYNDGSTSVPATIYPSVLDASALIAATSAGGYISNHGDVIAGATGLDTFFTLRDAGSARVNQQVYYANSLNDGVSWTAPGALFGSTPTLDGGPFGGNLSHPDAVFTGTQYFLYVSGTDPNGVFHVAVAFSAPPQGPPPAGIPAMGTFGLILAALLLGAIGAGTMARRAKRS